MPRVPREDLGALFARITGRLINAERPLLAGHGLSMWQYIVLAELNRRPAKTQLGLAESIGYDKTRLIGLLDDLQRRGLIEREPDPVDRRARTVQLTPSGHEIHAAARADIRAMEDGLLAELSVAERNTLQSALSRLAESP
jgi:DNA-binding MarR family transcriptional regulator